jgi:uncharacterized phage infection (PIP) family protein YhgE
MLVVTTTNTDYILTAIGVILLVHLLFYINFEVKKMAAIDDANTALGQTVADLNALVTTANAVVAKLQAGGGATDAQIQALTAGFNQIDTGVKAVQSALAPFSS